MPDLQETLSIKALITHAHTEQEEDTPYEFHVRKENIVFIPNITEDRNHKRQLNWSGNETIYR